jgi:hypothetical protein
MAIMAFALPVLPGKDVMFREYVMDVHGIDLTQPMPGPLSEMTFANQLSS